MTWERVQNHLIAIDNSLPPKTSRSHSKFRIWPQYFTFSQRHNGLNVYRQLSAIIFLKPVIRQHTTLLPHTSLRRSPNLSLGLCVAHPVSAQQAETWNSGCILWSRLPQLELRWQKWPKRSECSNDAWTQHIYPIYTRHNMLPVCMGRVYLSHLYRSKMPESFNRNVRWQQQEELFWFCLWSVK